MKTKVSLLTLLLISTISCPTSAYQADQTRRRKNVESFEMIWKTIKNTHWDESLVGDSWSAKRQELLPGIKSSGSNAEARLIMAKLIDSLEQSHFGVISADSYEAIEGVKGGNEDVGLTVSLINDQLLVTGVREGSTSEKAGVIPGWQLTKVRGKQAAELIKQFRNAEHGPQRAETITGLAMRKMLSGGSGKKLKIEFIDAHDQTRKLNIPCEPPPGRLSKFGNLPPIRVDDETRTYPGNIGYYRFSAFLDPMRIMPAWRKAVNNPQHKNGFIVDLRGNVGGLAGMTMGMTSAFAAKPSSLGTMTMKGNKLKFVANPVSKPFTGPVAVLVNEGSISSAEILAGGLQDLKLAKVFGSRTAGLAYPSNVMKLPNGDGFQYAIADYHSASGTRLEKTGVVPDEEITLTRELLLAKKDPVLTAAMAWIKSEIQQ